MRAVSKRKAVNNMGRCAVMVLLYLFWLQIYVYLFIIVRFFLNMDSNCFFWAGILKMFKISNICVGKFVLIINNVLCCLLCIY